MAATDTTPGTDSIRVPRSSAAVLSRADSRIIWLLLGAAFVAILNETTMGVAIPHLIVDLGITAVAGAVADDGVHADDGRGDPDLGIPAAALHDARRSSSRRWACSRSAR